VKEKQRNENCYVHLLEALSAKKNAQPVAPQPCWFLRLSSGNRLTEYLIKHFAARQLAQIRRGILHATGNSLRIYCPYVYRTTKKGDQHFVIQACGSASLFDEVVASKSKRTSMALMNLRLVRAKNPSLYLVVAKNEHVLLPLGKTTTA